MSEAMPKRKTIALDFDGPVHSYLSGWTGEIPVDPPVRGAREFIAAQRAAGTRVVVHTCRALTPRGLQGTIDWLARHGIEVDEVTATKPHANVYIDDRAHRFDGDWSKAAAAIDARPHRPEFEGVDFQPVPTVPFDVAGAG